MTKTNAELLEPSTAATYGDLIRLHIKPSLLATRAELKRLVCGQRDLPVLKGWRREVVGESLLGMLD